MHWQALIIAIVFLATPELAGPSHGSGFPNGLKTSAAPVILVSDATKLEPDTDIFALMSGKCSTLKIAGRDYNCRAVAYFHNEKGRARFAIALDDPADDSHVISFSGENSRREQDNLYELQIDRMLLNSRDRPKVDGLPVPSAELSTGTCTQLGNFGLSQVSSISCAATDKNGKKYELKFESDGSPMTVRKIRQMSLEAQKRLARQSVQLECRQQANAARILPRDWAAFVIRCQGEDSEKTAPDAPQ
jgi:hypothetical protein